MPPTTTTTGAALLARHGRPWTPAPLPPGTARGPTHGCFVNAAARAILDPRLRYCEGDAWHPGFAADGLDPHAWIRHAWTVDAAGVVTDAVWRHPERGRFFGVIVPTALVVARLSAARLPGVLGAAVDAELAAGIRAANLQTGLEVPDHG